MVNIVTTRVAEVARRTKILSPNILYFVAILRFVTKRLPTCATLVMTNIDCIFFDDLMTVRAAFSLLFFHQRYHYHNNHPHHYDHLTT